MIGNGCKVAFSATSPLSWTAVANVIDLSIPSLKSERVDSTVHSPTSNLRRAEPGLEGVDDPFFIVKMDLSNAVQAQIRAYKTARTNLWWRFEVPTNDAKTTFVGFEFQGRVASFEPAMPIGGLQTTRYTVMFDGTSIGEGVSGASQIS